MSKEITKSELTKELLSICGRCERFINSMKTKDGYPKRCPWRSISNDYCDFIDNFRKEIKRSYNED